MRQAAALVLIAILAAGCGGGSRALTRAEYVRRVDAICKRAIPTFRTLQPVPPAVGAHLESGNGIGASDYESLARYLGDLLRLTRPLERAVEDVPLPPHDRVLRRWRAANTASLRAIERMHRATLARDEAAFVAAGIANESATRQYVRLSRQAGFRVCARTVR